ncbi:hypothetical protein CCR97_15190 [Rhodoplanes elegans]|nr:hypothetical protein [Rhodoplanes elegans]
MRHRFYVPPPRPVGPPPGFGIGRTAHERLHSGLPPQDETRFIPREVVVQVADTVPRAQIESAARKHGITMVASHGFAGTGRTLYHFRTADGRDVRDVIRNLEREQVVAAAQPNYVYRLHQADAAPAVQPAVPVVSPAVPATPAVPIAPATPVSPATPAAPEPAAAAAAEQPLPPGDPGQYVIEKLKLVEAHAQARGRNVAIAVIDSDVDARHPDMHGAVTERFDPSGTTAKPHLHGTGMAGAILARYRLRGIAPDASIVAVKAFDERSTAPEATTFQILKGIDHAMRRGVRVINMSFAGPHDVMIARKLQEAYDKGIVLVAAAGNAGPTSPPLYPAADPNVIAVTATDRGDAPLPQANRGKHLAVAAPGVDILAPAPGGAYQLTTGTSIAAAHVSGVVALVLEKRPDLTPDEVRAILVGSAAPITGTSETETGAGLVDPVKALTYEPEMPEEPAVASGTPAKPKTPAAAAAAATSGADSGRSASMRQRDRMVGSSRPGEWLTRRSSARRGGSSRIFSSALAPSGYFSSSAASTTQMRQPPPVAVAPKKPTVSRTWSTVMTVRTVSLFSPGVRSSASNAPSVSAATRRTTGWSDGSASEVAACTAGDAGSGWARTKRAKR